MCVEKKLMDRLLKIRKDVREKGPLIHCITNPISINDCANIVLASGAKPIMAEHPAEVAEITAVSAALAVNLGNITDIRMQSMCIAGETAKKMHLPVILDLVGVGCSQLRYDYAKMFIEKCRPAVIKGNVSEIRAICGLASEAEGIDAGAGDKITSENRSAYEKMLGAYAQQHQAVLLASGAYDFVTDGCTSYLVGNGTPRLAQITGTGCMMNVLAASFLSSADVIGAVLLAAVLLGIAGEHASVAKGPGSFRTALLDEVYAMQDADLIKEAVIF